MNQEPSEKPVRSGTKADFHKSFWPSFLVWCCIPFHIRTNWSLVYDARRLLDSVYLISAAVGILLWLALRKKNYYLAKGFLWGGLTPVISWLLTAIYVIILFTNAFS